MMMPTTGAAIAAARPRPSPSPQSSLPPWWLSSAATPRSVPAVSFSGTPIRRCRQPRKTRASELRRRSSFFRSQRPSGATMSAVELQPSVALKAKAVELSQTLKGTSLFLVGMNNTVKTSLGKALADALRYYYFDSDSLVEEAAGGEAAAKALRERDERGFHESETEVLKQLSSMGRLVVCTGDGAVQSATNLAYLRYGISIWVDVPLDIVVDEVLKDTIQLPSGKGPSISDPFEQVLTEVASRYEEMKGGYGTADATVSLLKVASKFGYDDLGAVTAEDMALEALNEIEKLTRVKKLMEDAARPF